MRMLQVVLSIVTLALSASVSSAGGDTEFTYQGRLLDAGAPANGTFDVDFSLWDDPAAGNQVGSTLTFNSLPISDGLFTVELDFGANAFDNSDRWLAISVDGVSLMPRQPITRTPYSIQTRGIFVDENENVGIGTDTPTYPLHVVTDSDRAIFATTSGTYAGRFESSSTSGNGVYGVANAQSGTNIGVLGVTGSTQGRGVYGLAAAAAGTNYGVYGEVFSSSGYAGYFQGGRNYFEGNVGIGTDTPTYPLHVEDDINAAAIFGNSNAISGSGVFGQSSDTSGRGVYGVAAAATGTNNGGHFTSFSNSGRGVYGEASATTGTTYGVYGLSSGTNGHGVYGQATATSGFTYGGRFESDSSEGSGVVGEASAGGTGITYGGNFRSFSNSGRGVLGQATAFSGTNYGVYGRSFSTNGFDFYADGAGTDYGASSSRRWKNNVVPIGDPLAKLSKLQGVFFDWDEEHGGAHDVGMIAEEVGAVLPEIVQYEQNGVDAIGMDYSKMTPLLVEAVNALRVEKDAQILALRMEKDSEIRAMRAEKNAEIRVKDAEIAAQAMRLTKIERKNASLSDANLALQYRLDSLEQLVEQLALTAKEQPK